MVISAPIVIFYDESDIEIIIIKIVLTTRLLSKTEFVGVTSLNQLNNNLKSITNDVKTCGLMFHGCNKMISINSKKITASDVTINEKYTGQLTLISCSTGIGVGCIATDIQLRNKQLNVVSPTKVIESFDININEKENTIDFRSSTRYGKLDKANELIENT